MRKTLPIFLLLIISSACVMLAQSDPGGSRATLDAVPVRFRNGILKLSADNASPNPPQWFVQARGGDGEIHSITVAQGQIVEEKPSLDLRAALTHPSPIDLNKVGVDSHAAWLIAEKYASQKGRKLGSVSFALQQKGRDAAPVWAIWCYDSSVSYIGYLEILATTGSIISSE